MRGRRVPPMPRPGPHGITDVNIANNTNITNIDIFELFFFINNFFFFVLFIFFLEIRKLIERNVVVAYTWWYEGFAGGRETLCATFTLHNAMVVSLLFFFFSDCKNFLVFIESQRLWKTIKHRKPFDGNAQPACVYHLILYLCAFDSMKYGEQIVVFMYKIINFVLFMMELSILNNFQKTIICIGVNRNFSKTHSFCHMKMIQFNPVEHHWLNSIRFLC